MEYHQLRVPQIEVTFDIDANGIVNVSAKDLGTGKEQKVTITASSNLTDDEIEQAVKEAEKYAEEDKKKKEEIEIKNNADSLVYNTQKTMDELGDKIDGADKDRIQAEIDNTKSAIEENDIDKIKAASDKLAQVSYEVFGKIYQQEAGAAGAQPGGQGQGSDGGDDDVVDADYEVVDDDE